MHILLGLLTVIASILWALSHLGVDLGGLNPFSWKRRRQWRQRYETPPVHKLEKPIEAAAVILIGTVIAEGMVSRDQKMTLLELFENEFQQTPKRASELLTSGTFLLRDVSDLAAEIPHILAPCKDYFSHNQSVSLIDMLNRISALEGPVSTAQQNIIEAVRRELLSEKTVPGKW